MPQHPFGGTLLILIEQTDNGRFWHQLDQLLLTNRLVIDRPKNTAHPRYPDFVYPYDYGYLEGTSAGDGNGIDVWAGSLAERRLVGVICTVDMLKRDAEIKLLVGCTLHEMQQILVVYNDKSKMMAGLLVVRSANESCLPSQG